jgi:hypothetical protein
MVPVSFAGMEFIATREGALFCPATRTLVVADLHLEKASWYAALGQMLPPYDSLATLTALANLVDRLDPRTLWCLGDNFHDRGGPSRLPRHARDVLERITARLAFNWIVGNHDPALTNAFGGAVHSEGRLGSIALRHIAQRDAVGPELSGHFHPKLRLTLRGRRVARPCFVRADEKLILPAFGSLTGGMDAFDPAIALAAGRVREAMVVTDRRLVCFPNAVTEIA